MGRTMKAFLRAWKAQEPLDKLMLCLIPAMQIFLVVIAWLDVWWAGVAMLAVVASVDVWFAYDYAKPVVGKTNTEHIVLIREMDDKDDTAGPQ